MTDMGLETGTWVNDLVTTNPDGDVDPFSEGDDHLRLVKSVLKNTFPNATEALIATMPQLNGLVGNSPSFRNLLINGNMAVSQEGGSTTGVTTSGYYSCDCWLVGLTTLGTWTVAQDTAGPDGFANSLKLTCTTADASPAAGDFLIVTQILTGRDVQRLKKGTANAKSVTLSFKVKSNKTGTYVCELEDSDNSRRIAATYTISVADTWADLTLTFAGDTTGAFDNDNAGSLRLNFWLGAGTTYTSGTLNTSWGTPVNANRAAGQVNLADAISNYWQITGVQLEEGSVATELEHTSYSDNLTRCRFFYKRWNYSADTKAIVLGSVVSSTLITFPFKTGPMNSVPVGSFSGTFNIGPSPRTGTASWDNLDVDGLHAILFTATGTALGTREAFYLRWDTDANAYFELDARLL